MRRQGPQPNGKNGKIAAFPAPAQRRTRPVLVLGGAGFIGSNLAERLAREGRHVLVFDALSRPGVEENLALLKTRHPRRVSAQIADVRNADAVTEAVADAAGVFHLAAQVAVTTSIDDPQGDFDTNARGTLNVLEAVRRSGRPRPVLFASTNKVYGDLADIAVEMSNGAYRPCDAAIAAHGIGEDRPLQFHTPYGCSKGAADQYVLDYARTYGVPAAVMRMSCIYGPHQFGTEDQGWVAHFLISALTDEPITIYGDGCQVRDILYVEDAVSTYLSAYRRIEAVKGGAYNLGGGPANAISLRQLLGEIEAMTGRPVPVRYADWRPGDQRFYVSDTRRITRLLDLPDPLAWRHGLHRLADWLVNRSGLDLMAPAAPHASSTEAIR